MLLWAINLSSFLSDPTKHELTVSRTHQARHATVTYCRVLSNTGKNK